MILTPERLSSPHRREIISFCLIKSSSSLKTAEQEFMMQDSVKSTAIFQQVIYLEKYFMLFDVGFYIK